VRLKLQCTLQAAREDLLARERSHVAEVDYLRRECEDLRHELAQQQAQVRPAELLSCNSALVYDVRSLDAMQRVQCAEHGSCLCCTPVGEAMLLC